MELGRNQDLWQCCHHCCCLKSTWYPRRHWISVQNRLSFIASIREIHKHQDILLYRFLVIKMLPALLYDLMKSVCYYGSTVDDQLFHNKLLNSFHWQNFLIQIHCPVGLSHFSSFYSGYILNSISKCPTSIIDVTGFFAYPSFIYTDLDEFQPTREFLKNPQS